jgi:hypothetical protein
MAVRLVAAATCLAALTGGCVIREIREIRTEPAATANPPSCSNAASGVPGSVLADSQPPSPMVEEAGEPPGQDYVWVDGYWHWDGAEWIWISGRWVAPMADFVFVPPAYYTSGEACVYVPGYWQRGPRSPWPIRDHRPISIGGHVHRPHAAPHKPHHHIADHRGDKPTGKTGSLAGVGDDQDEVVVTVPEHPRPVPAAPSRPSAPPSSPTWRAPGASAPPPSAPPRPSAPPPSQARPAPPPPSSPPPRAAPSPGPARVAPPSAPARTAPPAPSPPPKAAPPPRPAQSAGPSKKK